MNPEEAKSTFRRARRLCERGRYSEALPLLLKLHAEFPEDSRLKEAVEACQYGAEARILRDGGEWDSGRRRLLYLGAGALGLAFLGGTAYLLWPRGAGPVHDPGPAAPPLTNPPARPGARQAAPPRRQAAPFFQRGNPVRYQVELGATVVLHNGRLESLVCALPLPAANTPYQDVGRVDPGAGEVVHFPGSSEQYARFIYSTRSTNGRRSLGRPPTVGQVVRPVVRFDITLYDIRVRPDAPYEPGTGLSHPADPRYLDGSGAVVSTLHPFIVDHAERLWRESGKDSLGYARACYHFVAETFSYRDMGTTGLHPIDRIISQKTGDCGNLSAVFVSLLRYRQIPARLLFARKPASKMPGTYHMWADFYLGGRGWVPVDVTYEISTPRRDFFGSIDAKTHGVVFNTQVSPILDAGFEKVPFPGNGLQGFAYRFRPAQVKLEWEEYVRFTRV